MKKLDARGFSHELLIVFVVVISAVVGVGLMVSSHAAKCSPRSKKPCAVSGPVSSAMSGPLSGKSATCVISGIASNPEVNSTIKPKLLVTNNGKIAINPTKVQISQSVYDTKGRSPSGKYKTINLKKLKPNSTASAKLSEYKVTYRTNSKVSVTWIASSTNPSFSCTATTILPVNPTQ